MNAATKTTLRVLAPTEMVERRLAACSTCPYGVRKVGVLTCGLCGCVMRFKVRFQGATCPHPDGSRWA